MPKLVLGFPAVEENSKWLPQEGGTGLEPRDLIMPVIVVKKERRIKHLFHSHPSCHIPSEVADPALKKKHNGALTT